MDPVGWGQNVSFVQTLVWIFDLLSSDGRRTVVGGACVVSGAEKKAFDRGGPVWPPRSNAADERLGGVKAPPSPKLGVLGGSAPQPKISKKITKKIRKNS